jgi:hypothetical protein
VKQAGWASGPVWRIEEYLAPRRFELRTVQPVARRCSPGYPNHHISRSTAGIKAADAEDCPQAICLLCACAGRLTVDWVHVATSLTNPEFYTRYTAVSTNRLCTQYVIFTISDSNYKAAVTAQASPDDYLATQLRS